MEGFFLAFRGFPEPLVQGKPVAEIGPVRLGRLFCTGYNRTFRASAGEIMTAISA